VGSVRLRVVLVLLAATFGGCVDSHITDAVRVTNDSSETLHFEIVTVAGERVPLSRTAAPGQTIAVLAGSLLSDGAGLTRNRCTIGELRAIVPDGRVVATWPPPVCADTTLTVR
jgi:hypothetical protein